MEKIYTEQEIYRIIDSGIESDCKSITRQLFAGADRGNADFANVAADWLRYGRYGLQVDINKSNHYLNIAVRALIPDAIYDYAMYLDGDSVEEKRSAFSYYILAAILGDTNAIDAVSEFFLYGDFAEQNDFLAGALRKHATYLRSVESE